MLESLVNILLFILGVGLFSAIAVVTCWAFRQINNGAWDLPKWMDY